MKLSFLAPLLVAAGIAVYAQQAMPRMTTVEPASGKVGDVITVSGENLQKEQVSKVFLTDGKNDVPVTVTEQAATSLKFTIPEKVKGRLALMLLTAGNEPKLIEQPVKLTVE